MANVDHGTIDPTNGPASTRGNHVIQGLADFANEAAREAFTVLAADVGRVARQTDTNKWYIAIVAGSGAASWQQIGSGGASGGSIVLGWNWLTDIVDNDPGSGNMKGNNATQGSITQLNINDVTSNGKNVTVVLESIHPDDVLIVTETSDATRFIIFEANGIAVDQTTYWEVPGVVSQASASPIRNNRECAVQILFASMSPLTTKGDLFTYDTADARLGVGAEGFNPVADPAATTGLSYLPSGTSSGILTGLEVTINGGDAATFDVASGTAMVWDWTGGTPTPKLVTFAGVTGATVTNIGTTAFSSLFLNAAGSIEQFQDVNPTATQRRELATLQQVVHPSTVITAISTDSQPAYDMAQAMYDYILALGPVNGGNLYSAGAANLTVAKAAGTTTLPFINRSNDTQDPSQLSNSAVNPEGMVYTLQDGVGGFDFITPEVTNVDVAQFDDGSGVLAAVSPTNRFTVQRFFYFGETDSTTVSYGQVLYSTLAEAEAAIFTENPVLSPLLENASFVSALVVQGNTTDLSDSADAKFVAINLGAISAGGTGAVTSVTSGDTDLVTVNPTIGDVVVTPANQEMDTTNDNNFYGPGTGNTGGRGTAVDNAGFGNDSFLVLNNGSGNNSFGDDNFDLLTDGSANGAIGRNTGGVLVTGDGNWFIGNNLNAPAAGTDGYVSIVDTFFMNSVTGAVRVGGSGEVLGQAQFQITGNATDDTTAVATFNNSAVTNGASTRMLFGDRDPSGVISQNPGTMYFRTNDASSTLYVNTSVSSGTTWVDLAAGGGAVTDVTSGDSDIILVSPTTGNVVVTATNQEIDITDNNTFYGESAGNVGVHSTALNNTGLGVSALAALTSGDGNTALGGNAGAVITTTADSTLLGFNAGLVNTAAEITAVGSKALAANTSGLRNTAFGYEALNDITTGDDSVALGYQALDKATGSRHTAVGSNAGGAVLTGTDTTFVGYNAGVVNTAGEITGVGSQALAANTSGVRNTAVGFQALNDVTTSDDCTAVGYTSLDVATGIDNTALGSVAGGAVTTGFGNTHLGKSAGTTVTTADNTIVIGANIGGVNTDQYLNIGNTIIGDMSSDKIRIGGDSTIPTAAQTLQVESANADTSPVFGMQQTGTAGASTVVHVGTQSPDTVITALPGAIYARVNATNSSIWVNTGAASGTTWTDLAAGGGAVSSVASGDSDIILVSPTTGAVVVTATNQEIDTTDGNTFYGENTGNVGVHSGAVDNVGLGKNSLVALTTGDRNLCFGTDSGAAITTASDCVFVGDGAGQSNTQIRIVAIGSGALQNNSSGSNNVAIGYEALNDISTNSHCTAIGVSCLDKATGTGNTAIGSNAGGAQTTATSCVWIGRSAGLVNTSSENTAIGTFAMQSNTSGLRNVGIGFEALSNIATNDDCTAIGHKALDNATGGANTAVGASAGTAITTGTSTTFVGSNSGKANTANNNTGIGSDSLLLNTSGIRNTAVGRQALSAVLTTNRNTAVGFNALVGATGASNTAVGSNAGGAATVTTDHSTFVGATAGLNNTAAGITGVGSGALMTNTSGDFNTALGFNAVNANITSDNNTGLGYNALVLATGSENTAVGSGAGAAVVAGSGTTLIGSGAGIANTSSDTTAVGAGALALNTSGLRNTAVGKDTLTNITTGDDCVALGFDALTVATGVENTAVGASSGDAVSTGQGNTFLGFDAGSGVSTASSTIIIGRGIAGVNTTDYMSIGDIIFGNTGASDPAIRIGGSGTVATGGPKLEVESSDADTVGVFKLDQTGSNGAATNVHVGTRDPSGTITALPGALYVRVSGVNSGMFINTGSGSGTTWTQL